MTIEFFGRASGGAEELQEPFKDWLRASLAEPASRHQFIVVFRAFMFHAQPMPCLWITEPKLAPNDIMIEVFAPGRSDGLCFALYLPEKGVFRPAIAKLLRSRAGWFL